MLFILFIYFLVKGSTTSGILYNPGKQDIQNGKYDSPAKTIKEIKETEKLNPVSLNSGKKVTAKNTNGKKMK